MTGLESQEVQQVLAEPDPIRRVRLAGEVMLRLQQTELEVSRLRRQAIELAAAGGMSYSEVARQVGLTRGRVSQIRSDAPPDERAFFGIGPLQLGVPLRRMPDRELPVVASEDLAAREGLSELLSTLAFHVEHIEIDPDDPWEPTGQDLAAICGPKSSPTIAKLLKADPALSFKPDKAGRWQLRAKQSKETFTSPMDDVNPSNTDVAYLGRIRFDDHRSLVLIAGVHAIGSLGAVHYLRTNLAALHHEVGDQPFSMVINSTHDGQQIVTSEAACQPLVH